jgi:hypothetical protein
LTAQAIIGANRLRRAGIARWHLLASHEWQIAFSVTADSKAWPGCSGFDAALELTVMGSVTLMLLLFVMAAPVKLRSTPAYWEREAH